MAGTKADEGVEIGIAAEADQDVKMYSNQWLCRKVAGVMSDWLLVLLSFAYCFKDLNVINNQCYLTSRSKMHNQKTLIEMFICIYSNLNAFPFCPQYFERHQSVSPGESAMYLNGLPIDMEIYDIFTLLDIMSSEARMMEGLFALGFEGDYLKRLIRLDLKSDAENFALDIRHHAVKVSLPNHHPLAIWKLTAFISL
ncbi:hypothetical protein ScPMuIL_018365 [Solemya velum]